MKIKIPGDNAIFVYPSSGKFISVPGGSDAIEVFQAGGIVYLIDDEFTTDLAAGSVNGTLAEPGPGTREVVDTGNHLSISSSKMRIVTSGIDDPIFSYGAIDREAGRIFVINANIIIDGAITLWLGTNAVNAWATGESGFQFNFGDLLSRNGGSYFTIMTYSTATPYNFINILRLSGVCHFAQDTVTGKIILLYDRLDGNTATLYLLIGGVGGTMDCDFIRIPEDLWLPSPLLSDGFGGTWPTTDGKGHAEGITGGIGAGGGGLTWIARLGTWGIAAGVASSSALDASGISIATATLNTADVFYSCILGYSAGSGGVIVRYKDAANYVYAVNDGTNVKLFEVVTGTPYPGTQRGTGVKAPAAGARLIVDVSGAASRVYYNEALIFTYASVADTTAKTIGLITDNTGNTFNDAVAYAKGTGGEHSTLDKYSGA